MATSGGDPCRSAENLCAITTGLSAVSLVAEGERLAFAPDGAELDRIAIVALAASLRDVAFALVGAKAVAVRPELEQARLLPAYWATSDLTLELSSGSKLKVMP